MSKKSKGVVLGSTPSYGVGVYEDAKARLKHQSLMQDFQELQKETDAMRSKLEAAKQRKLMLAAEVRFLRRRYEYFVRTNTTKSSENVKLVQPPIRLKQKGKQVKEQNLVRKEAHQRKLPPIPEPKPKKKRNTVKEVAQHQKKMLYVKDPNINRENLARYATPVLDLNEKEGMQGANNLALRNRIAAFDLNQDSVSNSPWVKEASLPTRPPIFDLNEISTGDEDFECHPEGAKVEEFKKGLTGGPNDDMQNDLNSAICRNAGEVSFRLGKRKISWQDPVALRV